MKNPYTSPTLDQAPPATFGFAGACGAAFVCAAVWTLFVLVLASQCPWDDFHHSFAFGVGYGIAVMSTAAPLMWLVVWGIETASEWHWRRIRSATKKT